LTPCAAAADELKGGGLSTVAAIRRLSVDQTRQNIPVHLHGVVTFFDERVYSRFIQDETAGIYLQFPTNVAPPGLLPGQVVDVTGVSSPGEYAPVVIVNEVKVTGSAALPVATPVTYEQLANGVEDSQFIEITGIVRTVRYLDDSQYYLIEIAAGGGRLLIYARNLPVKQTDELLDSTVRVRGVCATKFNHQRQLFAIRLMVPRPEDLQIVAPAPKDAAAAAPRPIGTLLQFAPQQNYGHRVKVVGTVIYFWPGEAVFIQEGRQGAEVHTAGRAPLALGDRAEVLGFVSQGQYTPMLEDAVYRKISAGQPPEPIVLTPDEVLKGNNDCCLIKVTARVLDHTLHGAERSLILQEGGSIFHADLKQTEGEDAFSGLPIGTRVAATGVCQIDPGDWVAGEAWRAKAFSIKLRSAADIAVVQAAPWWTLEKVLWMAGALAFASLGAFGWVAVLHRQIAERTRQLEVQIQGRQRAERSREIEQERARVAHDLHDDLGAGLTEVNMLSTLAKSPATSPQEKERYLSQLTATARRIVTSLDEIVWAVNPRNDTVASLASYFGSYAQGLLELAGISCGLEVAEEIPEYPLDPKFRQELFLAFKEAITNVIRHSKATQVRLRISLRENRLSVEVSDDGRGFNLAEQKAGRDGLANMTERLKRLHGECIIESDTQHGTMVRLSAPLPERLV
jgi:signal transduction histidine kinase